MKDTQLAGTYFLLSMLVAIIGGFCWHWQIGVVLLSATLLLLAIGASLK